MAFGQGLARGIASADRHRHRLNGAGSLDIGRRIADDNDILASEIAPSLDLRAPQRQFGQIIALRRFVPIRANHELRQIVNPPCPA